MVTPVVEFEDEFVQIVRQLWEEQFVFNQTLGLKMTGFRPDRVTGRIAMRRELGGNHLNPRIHGGVISSALDAIGGLSVLAAIAARHMGDPPADRTRHFNRTGTIDLRVDYLRQGLGDHFDMQGQVLRLGSRVAATRMEFLGPDGQLVAAGSGAYIVG